MKPSPATAKVNCPGCAAPLPLPITFRAVGRTTLEAHVDTSAAREHVEGHRAADSGEGSS